MLDADDAWKLNKAGKQMLPIADPGSGDCVFGFLRAVLRWAFSRSRIWPTVRSLPEGFCVLERYNPVPVFISFHGNFASHLP